MSIGGGNQYENFNDSNMLHEGDDGYDDSKAEVMVATQQTDP